MKNDLPSVFANKIDKEINNSQEIFYGDRANYQNNMKDNYSIRKKINDIFNSPNFVYKSTVKITTSSGVKTKTIVGTNNGYLLTMDNDSINIDDITNIETL